MFPRLRSACITTRKQRPKNSTVRPPSMGLGRASSRVCSFVPVCCVVAEQNGWTRAQLALYRRRKKELENRSNDLLLSKHLSYKVLDEVSRLRRELASLKQASSGLFCHQCRIRLTFMDCVIPLDCARCLVAGLDRSGAKYRKRELSM